ncbi:MAG: protein translocase subunit SecDF, partial [Bacteroidota bacterium]|nr:protein translocase subunit SecDF [Bacteroidota bacterium]
SDAEAYANGDPAKETAYLDSMSNQTVYDLGFTDYTYSEVKDKELNLGLDLRGGMNVILEVSVRDIILELANNSQDETLRKAISASDKELTNSQDAYLEIFFREFDRINQESGTPKKYADPTLFGTKEMTDRLGFNASDEEVKEAMREDVDAAIANVFTVLRARIDQFGVVQPNIQRLENTGRILVELPGVKDPERVQKLLQSTAELEFWNLYEGVELLNFLGNANEKLRSIVERPSSAKAKTDTTAKGTEEVNDILDIQTVDETPKDSLTEAIEDSVAANAAEDAVEVVDSSEIQDEQFNPLLFTLLYPNIDQQGNPRPGAIVGFALPKDTAKINKYLRMAQIRALLPADKRYTKFLWTAKPDEGGLLYLLAVQGNREGKPELSGDVIVDARPDFDEFNRPMVTMSMNAVGAQKWQRITRDASQQEPKRSVAVVLDNLVFSYPQVQNEIPGGNTRITGNFTIEESEDLANILKAGKLPAPARIIQADIVGPSLGQEAINASLISFMIALVVVMLYMMFYYAKAGAVADLALILNMFFIFGILASLGAVLTLPGMAGIVLTIGMAVDANVLIFERIREELNNGKGMGLAIRDGYKNSYSSIIDANVTTLLTGIILYAFGTGPIRGFATTLIIGILTSLFCAIFISRLSFEWMLSRKQEIKFFTNISRNWFTGIAVKFLEKRKTAYIISGVVLAISLGSLFTKGLNLGVDFVGGRSYQVRFDQPVSVTDISQSLSDILIDQEGNRFSPVVKTLGDDNQVIITTKYRISETGTEVEKDINDKVYNALKDYFKNPISEEDFFANSENGLGMMASRQVGPTIADDIKTSAIWSVLFSLIVVFLYILVRFKKWQFSLGAVGALMHDVIIILGAFSLLYGIVPFQLEVDQAFIAAILTVVGYSLNDTVVVFDRIREYFGHYHSKRPRREIINGALNGTLSRTFNTSLTTFFVMLIIFLFGGEVIRGFMFALLLGIVVGTYSSLFIATPIFYDAGGNMKDEDI